jgi:hypothetical protein
VRDDLSFEIGCAGAAPPDRSRHGRVQAIHLRRPGAAVSRRAPRRALQVRVVTFPQNLNEAPPGVRVCRAATGCRARIPARSQLGRVGQRPGQLLARACARGRRTCPVAAEFCREVEGEEHNCDGDGEGADGHGAADAARAHGGVCVSVCLCARGRAGQGAPLVAVKKSEDCVCSFPSTIPLPPPALRPWGSGMPARRHPRQVPPS